MPNLSILILSYNTSEMTKRCLESLKASLVHISVEVIVVDNASTDNSVAMLEQFIGENKSGDFECKLIKNKENVGFGKGNNQALAIARGEYVLYLNSDVLIAGWPNQKEEESIDWSNLLTYMRQNPKVGALTVRVVREDGTVDAASHRGFPTLWRSFTYYAGGEKLARLLQIPLLKKLFGGYHLTSKDLNTIHEIDSGTGAFLLCPRVLLQELNGFDERFFMYGEDLDLAYRIFEKNHIVVWYPKYTVLHLKYQSGLGSTQTKTKTKIHNHFYDAMWLFYEKHYKNRYPTIISWFVRMAIDFLSWYKKI